MSSVGVSAFQHFSFLPLAPSLLVIHETDDHPTHRTFGVANRLARSQTVGRDHHGFMQGCAVGIDGDLRDALGLAAGVDGLANEQSPPRQAGVLASGSQVAFNAGQPHGKTPNTKHQASRKLQIPNSTQTPTRRGCLGTWCLRFPWGLVFGAWCFAGPWCLVFEVFIVLFG